MNDKTYEYKRYMRDGSVKVKTAVVRSRSSEDSFRRPLSKFKQEKVVVDVSDQHLRLIAEEA